MSLWHSSLSIECPAMFILAHTSRLHRPSWEATWEVSRKGESGKPTRPIHAPAHPHLLTTPKFLQDPIALSMFCLWQKCLFEQDCSNPFHHHCSIITAPLTCGLLKSIVNSIDVVVCLWMHSFLSKMEDKYWTWLQECFWRPQTDGWKEWHPWYMNCVCEIYPPYLFCGGITLLVMFAEDTSPCCSDVYLIQWLTPPSFYIVGTHQGTIKSHTNIS